MTETTDDPNSTAPDDPGETFSLEQELADKLQNKDFVESMLEDLNAMEAGPQRMKARMDLMAYFVPKFKNRDVPLAKEHQTINITYVLKGK